MNARTFPFVLLALLVPAAAGSSTIYKCSPPRGTGTVYSDRPCGADAQPHQVDSSRVTVYESPAISARASSPKTSRPKAARKQADAFEKQQAKCERLDQSLQAVRDKLRSGYGVQEGERLKARQKTLGAQRRTNKCR